MHILARKHLWEISQGDMLKAKQLKVTLQLMLVTAHANHTWLGRTYFLRCCCWPTRLLPQTIGWFNRVVNIPSSSVSVYSVPFVAQSLMLASLRVLVKVCLWCSITSFGEDYNQFSLHISQKNKSDTNNISPEDHHRTRKPLCVKYMILSAFIGSVSYSFIWLGQPSRQGMSYKL